jgi:hypothetical protein
MTEGLQAMLSMSKAMNAGQAGGYFSKEDYYLRDAELGQNSKWCGEGARALGLDGPVREEDVRSLCRGEDPGGNRIVSYKLTHDKGTGAVVGYFEGHPLKDCLSMAKMVPKQENCFFQALLSSVTTISTIADISLCYGVSLCCIQSPIRIKTVFRKFLQFGPFRLARTRKPSVPDRVHLVYQVLWLLTSPSLAHGVGSKDVDNCYMLGGAAANQAYVVLPTPMLVHRSSQFLCDYLVWHKWNMIPYDVICCPC